MAFPGGIELLDILMLQPPFGGAETGPVNPYPYIFRVPVQYAADIPRMNQPSTAAIPRGTRPQQAPIPALNR